MNRKHSLTGLILAFLLAACTGTPALPGITPVAGDTPSPTPVPTGVTPPTVTPVPTPIPPVRVSAGDLALFNGDYERARAEYQSAYYSTGDPAVRAAALYGLGRTEFEDGNYNLFTLNPLRELVAAYPDSSYTPPAYILLGKTYDELMRYGEAAEAYAAYLNLESGLLDAYAQEWRGDSLWNAGDPFNAIDAYLAALAAPRTGDRTSLEIKIARAYADAGDATIALNRYADIAARSSNDYIKAQMDFLSGQLYLNLGQPDQAYPFFQHTVLNYPLAYDSFSALVALEEAGIYVDDLSSGLVYYFAGRYGTALLALNRYEIANPQNDGTVYYYRALALRELGYYGDSILDWDYLIDNYPENRYWLTAWDEKAYTQWAYLNDYTGAAQTLMEFVSYAPSSLDAPRFMLSAGRMYERGQDLENAALTWERLADQYPASNLVPLSLFWGGIARYRSGNLDLALVDFQRSLLLSTASEDQARAYFWIGKIQQSLGNTPEAQTAWQQAATIDPTGYYSERAQDLLLGRDYFEPPASYHLTYDAATERAEAETWMRVVFGLPPDTNLGSPGVLLDDPRLQRGTALWELGFYDDARLEFEDLRQAVSENSADCYRLGNYLLDLGLYRSAVFAHRQVLTLAGMDTQAETLSAPRYFNHVRYGPYYADLIIPIAQYHDLHPLLLISIIRQESLFEGFVRSGAGARGLMQIIPSTGETLAASIGWPLDYTADDLYRPYVSITYGAHYLDLNRDRFNRNYYAALAAYNGGPGNAAIWLELAGNDPDLLVEIIRFEETRTYIRSIYEIFAMYRNLYSTVP